MSRVLVFTGPTLPAETVQEIVPQAEILPPVAAGDLLRLSLQAGDLVAIIDGFYFQAASVRHKELLSLLARGIHVWGAASMGALRAAELAPFGMRGFGAIFQSYQQGEIDGDDEVAVLHAPQEIAYLTLTEALVNIRYACQAAVSQGLLTRTGYTLILEVAAQLPFFERTYARIWQIAAARGLDAQTIALLRPFVGQERLNLKRLDAHVLLQALQTPPEEPFSPDFVLQETNLLRTWRLQEEGFFVKETWISYRDLLTAYQVLGKGYPQVHDQVLRERLCEIALQETGCGPQACGSDVQALSRSQQVTLIAHFFAARYNFPTQGTLPASALRWLRAEEQALEPAEQLTRLGVRLWQSTFGADWQEKAITHLKGERLLPVLVKLVYRTRRFCQTLQEREGEMLLARLLPERVYTWLRMRWQVSEAEFDLAVLERGFRSRTACWLAAGPFYLCEKYAGAARAARLVVQQDQEAGGNAQKGHSL
jgi:hypothetical protein